MLPLLAAFVILALAFRRLLRPPAAHGSGSSWKTSSPEPEKRSSAHTKLVEEAFEFSSVQPDDEETHPVLILYATEYGFALQVARSVAEMLTTSSEDVDAVKLYPRIVNVLHFSAVDLTRERFVIFICSTTGDGVPPNEAAAFRDALVAKRLNFGPSMTFSILALGDRAYPHFCRAGTMFDELLTAQVVDDMGGKKLLARQDIDQEDWEMINDWTERLCEAVTKVIKRHSEKEEKEEGLLDEDLSSWSIRPKDDYLHATIEKYAKTLSTGTAQYTRNNPFPAMISARRRLTAAAVEEGHKEVVRIEVDISGSGLSYEVGDAVGILPQNDPVVVNQILRALAANGDEEVKLADGQAAGVVMTFEGVLLGNLDLAVVRPGLIVTLARFSSNGDEVLLAKKILGYDPRDPTKVDSKSQTVSDFGKDYIAKRHVYDVLTDFPSAGIGPQKLVDALRPLHARYYSISSSAKTSPDMIAMTVDVLRWRSALDDSRREGVASSFLCDRARVDETKVKLFISGNPNFRLPVDGNRPVVMIGPGTGIAPFVGFVEQRVHEKAQGENVLFFGCRYEKQDFLYRDELERYAKRQQLDLFTAFSRDGDSKVYVQQRMREQGEKLWKMIDEQQAHLYVCGDGARMAGDVDEALHEIVQTHGGVGEDEAKRYMERLTENKRYQRDVWVS